MVNAANARDEDNGFATDNAISALGKMILYQPEALAANRAAAVGMFLNYLPVTVDEEEGIKVHGCLCTLLERGEPALLEQVWLVPLCRCNAKALPSSLAQNARGH